MALCARVWGVTKMGFSSDARKSDLKDVVHTLYVSTPSFTPQAMSINIIRNKANAGVSREESGFGICGGADKNERVDTK